MMAAASVAMPSSPTLAEKEADLEDTLRARIGLDLVHYLHNNAIFLAERLVAQHQSEENVHLLATCYYQSGHTTRAIAVLENATRPENRYLLAVCCFQQNKLVDAENALCHYASGLAGASNGHENIPNGAAGLYLMGRICRRANRRQQAIEFFVKALEIDSSLWSAYEELCDLGTSIDASRFFGTASSHDPSDADELTLGPEDVVNYEYDEEDSVIDHAQDGDDRFRTPQVRPTGSVSTPQDFVNVSSRSRQSGSTPQLSYRTPNTMSDSGDAHGNNRPGSATNSTPTFASPQGVVKKPRVGAVDAPPHLRIRRTYRRPLTETDETQRRNARLSFSSAISEDSPQDFNKMHSTSTPVAARLFQSAVKSQPRSPPTKSRRRSDSGKRQLLQLLSSFGAIYQKMSVYMCREALELLQRLPLKQRPSGWVQHQIGRAHFELADYNQAHDVFRAMYRAEPHRMAGLDLYSTTLWHLKKEVETSYLAQQVTDFDKHSPEAWCVAGNCFSLQKEHDTALAFFQRSIQLDPYFTYAYTLSGHEYVANEDFEKAVSCYRHAIRVDPRHYNAWYGLGTIYYRQEKFEFAEYHFRRALEINPRSSLLHCYLGMVLHSTQQFDEALQTLAIASELQPLNPQSRFQRANVLITMHRYAEAMDELNVVRNFAPRESSVHFMMGKVAKKLGRHDDALRCFTTALYFHPKDNNLIKSAIDKIDEPDLEDDGRL